MWRRIARLAATAAGIVGVVAASVLLPWAYRLNWTQTASLGTYLYGLATAILAVAAVVGGLAAWLQYQQAKNQRRRDRDQDLARYQSELVVLLRDQHSRTAQGAPRQEALTRLEEAEVEYEATLRGIVLGTPELRAAVTEYMGRITGLEEEV